MINYGNQLRTYNKHDVHHISMHTAEHTEFPIYSYVLVQYENLEHKPPCKLHPNLRGAVTCDTDYINHILINIGHLSRIYR